VTCTQWEEGGMFCCWSSGCLLLCRTSAHLAEGIPLHPGMSAMKQ
jgi:hypothetical protein